ncbi:zf-HC2 domain-containing protein [Nocardiopsis suaedae]|uniref:Zf-HC2 domain-containing protein n=1 Tax=Nocardiopsis suaedae TaxID=3018444 RepID=A0ABT4TE83_9ACTN|nr:zf-HC2 domain-containing protein [Nocardiopsis suaedae]MDA2802950.1 zf-HC2 domain-containing protein [Nocardiopsis suaedae]
MTCEECRTALSAEIDGEGTGQGARAVRRHLSACAGCARWLDACWALEGLLDAAEGGR